MKHFLFSSLFVLSTLSLAMNQQQICPSLPLVIEAIRNNSPEQIKLLSPHMEIMIQNNEAEIVEAINQNIIQQNTKYRTYLSLGSIYTVMALASSIPFSLSLHNTEKTDYYPSFWPTISNSIMGATLTTACHNIYKAWTCKSPGKAQEIKNHLDNIFQNPQEIEIITTEFH